MKLATYILAAAALLASSASSIPLNQPVGSLGLSARTGSKTPYDIDEPIKMMLKKNHDSLQNVCNTKGGWEGAAQVNLEVQFQQHFDLNKKKLPSIREVAVYKEPSMAADFVLPPTDSHNGMIIELKCENKYSNAGAAMKSKVQIDINKAKNLKDKYKDYNFRVVAMAYSPEAEKALTTELQLQIIPGATLSIEDSAYESGSSQAGSDTDMKDVTDTQSDGGKSQDSSKSLKVKVYQKEVDPEAPDTSKTAPTRASDRKTVSKSQGQAAS